MSHRKPGQLVFPTGGTFHTQFERLPNGQLKQIQAPGPYADGVDTLYEALCSRDASLTRSGGRIRGFFGKWEYSAPPDKPEPVPFSVDIKEQPEQADFQKAKNSGIIVMNPAVLHKVKLLWHPAVVPAGPIVAKTPIALQAADFEGVTEIITGNGLIKLPNGNYYNPRNFKFTVDYVAEDTWSLPYLNLPSLYTGLTGYERDGGLVAEAGAALNEATLDILTELAEMPSTVGMIRDGLSLFSNRGKKMRRLVTDIAEHSGSPKGMLKVADKVAQARLLYRYGILPLSYTFNDAKEVMKETYKRTYTAGNATKTVSEVPEILGLTFSGSYTQDHRAFFKRRLDPDSSLDQFQNVFSINLPLTVWELTPWSLVVDWFVNVGDYLTSINPMPSMQEKGCYSVRTRMAGKYTNKDGNVLEVDLTTYNRSLITRVLDSSIQFAPNMNNARYFDAAAFSWQILRGKIRKLKK